jgi:hypothetical protein
MSSESVSNNFMSEYERCTRFKCGFLKMYAVLELDCLILYKENIWQLLADLKIIALSVGLQGGFTRCGCSLRLWDIQRTEHHYAVKSLTAGGGFIPGKRNVKNTLIVGPKCILLPLLPTMLGLINDSVKVGFGTK